MAFDDERLSTNPTDKEQWAEDHGYSHGTCRIHGGFWTDTGDACPLCLDDAVDHAEDEEDIEDEEHDYSALYDEDTSEPLGDYQEDNDYGKH